MAADSEATELKKSKKRIEKTMQNGIDDDEEEETNFSDPEGYVDDVSEEELVADVIKEKPTEYDGFDSVIVVDHVPKVGPERLEKLQSVVKKIFQKFGKIRTEHYPMSDGKTSGYVFLEYACSENALEAVKMANNYKLDKQHTFIVNQFSDFQKYENIPDEWEPPTPKPYKDMGNLRSWLLNNESYDQFSVIYEGGEKTSIFSNTPNQPALIEERSRWTETYVRWSPQGTYLATFHQKGIALWGGSKFEQIMKFSHPGVQLIDFSPCERYLVSFSPLLDSKEDPQAIIIWDIRTGQKKRGFHCESQSTWPIFKWNKTGEYFARLGVDTLSVYETPSFGLLDKKSLKLPTIKDFSWSPTDNIIAYSMPEQKNVPARVVLINIPKRTELCKKNIFGVADCKMHWQKQGDYLCVKVDRYSKAKKLEEKEQYKYRGIYYNFEIFRIREKQIPVDEFKVKENIIAFAWEPSGSKFAYIHGESPRISVTFCNIRQGGKVETLKTFEKRQANHLFWSPCGQFIVLAGLRSMNGILEFIDTNDMTVMAQTEHFMATDVEWDPTGRYVVSGVSYWGHKVDNAYWLWSFQGRLLQKQSLDRFCQLLWRPRPVSLLTKEQIREIKKNMKKYNVQFEIKDKMSQTKASKELIDKRQSMLEEFRKYRADKEQEYNLYRERRIALRDGHDTDSQDTDPNNYIDETIEFLVSVEEIFLE